MRLGAAHPTRDRIPRAFQHDSDLVHQRGSKQHQHTGLWNDDDLAIAKLGLCFVDDESPTTECWQVGSRIALVEVEQERPAMRSQSWRIVLVVRDVTMRAEVAPLLIGHEIGPIDIISIRTKLGSVGIKISSHVIADRAFKSVGEMVVEAEA